MMSSYLRWPKYLERIIINRLRDENGLGQASAHSPPPRLHPANDVEVDNAAGTERAALQLPAARSVGRKARALRKTDGETGLRGETLLGTSF